MKIIILSRYHSKGGAAIAAKRLFDSFNLKNSFECLFVTPQIIESKNKKYLFSSNFLFKFIEKIIFKLDTFIFILFNIDSPLRSLNFFGLINANFFNKNKNLDIVNIHWVNGGCISLSNIFKIEKNIILTLHDSWLVNGTSHYPTSINYYFEKEFNFIQNLVLKKIEDKYIIYKRKKFSKISCIIVPSTWLYDLLLKDSYFSKFPIYKIPNSLDLNIYKPLNNEYKLRNKFKIIAFYENKFNFLKGSDLLHELILKFKGFDDVEFHLIGNNLGNNKFDTFPNVFFYGFVHNEFKLVELYSRMDLCISTSRSENLSQFLTQACACSLPLIAFDVGGNSDIIHNGKNGYLIKPFDIDLFFSNIIEISKNRELLYSMRAISLNISKDWDSKLIALHYEELFIKYYDYKSI